MAFHCPRTFWDIYHAVFRSINLRHLRCHWTSSPSALCFLLFSRRPHCPVETRTLAHFLQATHCPVEIDSFFISTVLHFIGPPAAIYLLDVFNFIQVTGETLQYGFAAVISALFNSVQPRIAGYERRVSSPFLQAIHCPVRELLLYFCRVLHRVERPTTPPCVAGLRVRSSFLLVSPSMFYLRVQFFNSFVHWSVTTFFKHLQADNRVPSRPLRTSLVEISLSAHHSSRVPFFTSFPFFMDADSEFSPFISWVFMSLSYISYTAVYWMYLYVPSNSGMIILLCLVLCYSGMIILLCLVLCVKVTITLLCP